MPATAAKHLINLIFHCGTQLAYRMLSTVAGKHFRAPGDWSTIRWVMGDWLMGDKRSNIVSFPCQPSQELRAEAASFTELYGRNPYSDFLLGHGRRPGREPAAAIGRIMGIRVRSDDGSLQPRRTKAEQTAARRSKNYQRTEADYLDQILRFRCVL